MIEIFKLSWGMARNFERRLNPRSTLPLEGRVKAGKRSSYFTCKGCSWIGGWPWAGVLNVKTEPTGCPDLSTIRT